jgi:uncharacterized protein (DUF2132 family)
MQLVNFCGFFLCIFISMDIEQQPNNPLHGVKLVEILEYLTQNYTWEDLAGQVNINCFKSNPTIKSSLKFLRRTPWAREKVEHLYLQSIKK